MPGFSTADDGPIRVHCPSSGDKTMKGPAGDTREKVRKVLLVSLTVIIYLKLDVANAAHFSIDECAPSKKIFI